MRIPVTYLSYYFLFSGHHNRRTHSLDPSELGKAIVASVQLTWSLHAPHFKIHIAIQMVLTSFIAISMTAARSVTKSNVGRKANTSTNPNPTTA